MRLAVLFMMLLAQLATGGPPMVKPNCEDYCGNVMIPYPFGMQRRDCYKNKWFEIQCNRSKPFLPSIGMEVLKISFRGRDYDEYYTRVIVKGPIISNNNCSGIDGSHQPLDLTGTPFYFSYASFVAVGCNISAFVNYGTTSEIAGCNTRCIHGQKSLLQDWPQQVFSNSSRYTVCDDANNCCQTSAYGQQVFDPVFQPRDGDHPSGCIDGYHQVGCSLAFIADSSWVDRHLYKQKQLLYVPLSLFWEEFHLDPFLEKVSTVCSETFAGNGTVISASDCGCAHGYKGNPYLGCEDIDECRSSESHLCEGITKCVNTPGSFKCVNNPIWLTIIIIAGTIGLLAILFGCWWAYKYFKRRSKSKQRKKFFKRNGGLLLQQQVTLVDGSLQKTKIYNSKDLEKATDNFNKNRVLGQGGQGTVYKGMLVDGRIVAVKKSTLVDEEKLQEFINEFVLLSQINHRNVVKLLGCCLETEVPLLVYEYIPNGSLFQYIHDLKEDDVPLSWELRVQIATEVAGAVAYLHSAASSPIYHRDIKSTNILLDEKFRAKVSDFGTSRSITIDQTHLTTHVQGTMGYLDPEYFQSSQFTAKSDVYSFGVVLVELLSGQKPICWGRSEESRSLTTYFNFLMEEDKLFEIVDITIRQQKHEQQVIAVANLAKRCLNLYGRFRPDMREVAIELEYIRSSSPTIEQNTQATVSNASPSVVSCDYKDNMSGLSFEVEPLISYQTW